MGADISTSVQLRTPSRSDAADGMAEKHTLKLLVFLEASTVAGAVKPVLEFAREAAASQSGRAVDLTMVLFARSGQQNDLISLIRGQGISLEVVAERHAFDPGVVSQLRQIADKVRPDIIWTNNTKSHFLVFLSGLHRNAEWIGFHHGYTKEAMRTRMYNELDRLSLPRAKRVVTVCNDFAGQLRQKGVPSEHIRVLRNPIRVSSPVPEADVVQLRAKLKLNNASVLLSVGRLSQEKGHADLLRALDRLRTSKSAAPGLHLVLVGDGPERQRLEKLCYTLRLENCVTFTGYQSDVRPYFAMADIFVLPSHSEGSPNVLLEAVAAGLPIVATAVGGLPEVLTNEVNALLVPKHDIAQLANALARLLNDSSLRQRLAENGKEILTQHDPQTYFRKVMGIFEEAIGESAAT